MTMESNADRPVLYRPDDVSRLGADLRVMEQAVDWCREYLAKPHPDLGRSGPVCPFVPYSLRMNRIVFAVVRSRGWSAEAIEATVGEYRDTFLHMPPVDGPEALEKAIMVLLPDVSPEEAPLVVDE